MEQGEPSGGYDHLNERTPVKAETTLDLDAVAEAATNTNYGVHRLLSALERACTKKGEERERERGGGVGEYETELAKEIRELLKRRLY